MAQLFVVSPHTDDLHGVLFFEDLIDESVLDIDPAGVSSSKVANEFLEWWWVLKRVGLEDVQ